ncbi:MAG: signal peptidase II [Nitrospinae bacterium]|nr:signal peptidase II [Nitrospinota bacterium]
MRNKYLVLFFVSGFLIVIDQYTKFMVSLHIPLNYSIKVMEGFFNLTHIRNSGVAFGLFASQQSEYKPLMFIIISSIAILAILVIFHQTPKEKKIVQTGLILIFSGAIGNLIDRSLHGEVIDFVDFFIDGYHFPAFNIADSCITIGVALMVVDLFCGESQPGSTTKVL